MRRRDLLLTVPLLTVSAALAESKSGNFAEFFIAEIKARTDRVLSASPSPIPNLKGSWRIERDEHGFQIWIAGIDFGAVDGFLTMILGPAQAPAEKNLKGELQSGYYRNASGMHIQLVDQKPELFLVAVGRKKSER